MLSIVTPVLNGASFIEENIKAIMKLKIPFEHVIVDGGSTDGTLKNISKYKHIKLVHQKEKSGMYGAIHLGFSVSEGEIFIYVNADDCIVPSGIESMYAVLNSSKSYHVAYSDALFHFKRENRFKKIKGKPFAPFFLKRGIFPFVQSSVMFTKAIYEEVGGLRWNEFKIAGDMDLFSRFTNSSLGLFKKVTVTSSIFLKYGESLGDKNSELARIELLRAGIPTANFLSRLIYKLVTVTT